jgi:hypothetical protein
LFGETSCMSRLDYPVAQQELLLAATKTSLCYSERSSVEYAYPHNSNPRPANAAALLRQEEAATSAAGA